MFTLGLFHFWRVHIHRCAFTLLAASAIWQGAKTGQAPVTAAPGETADPCVGGVPHLVNWWS